MGIVKDAIQIAKIVAAVTSLFNLNSMQQTELNNYVRLQQYQWVEQRKTEAEIEYLLKSEAQRISSM